jgi:hypothetical protein
MLVLEDPFMKKVRFINSARERLIRLWTVCLICVLLLIAYPVNKSEDSARQNFSSGSQDISVYTDVTAYTGTTAWWGTLYPKFCFAQKEQENSAGQAKEEGEETYSQPKISFYLAKFFDWC